MKALLAAAIIALPCSVLAQTARPTPMPEPQPQRQQGEPQRQGEQQQTMPPQAQRFGLPPLGAGTPNDAKPEDKPEPCGNFPMAQNAIYAVYIRMISDELPDPAKIQGEAMGSALEALYKKHVEAAQAGDINAVRKATAYELFGMQIQRRPPADPTQERLCVLAQAPGREGLIDTLACAVALVDGPRKERPGAREKSRQMMEKAAASIPPEANASDVGKLLFDSVARGMQGCN